MNLKGNKPYLPAFQIISTDLWEVQNYIDMRKGITITGIAALLTGMLTSLRVIPSLTNFFSSYFPEYSKAVLLIAGFLLLLTGLFSKTDVTKAEYINPNDMKNCPSCGKLIPSDAFRCPECGIRFKSLYENL